VQAEGRIVEVGRDGELRPVIALERGQRIVIKGLPESSDHGLAGSIPKVLNNPFPDIGTRARKEARSSSPRSPSDRNRIQGPGSVGSSDLVGPVSHLRRDLPGRALLPFLDAFRRRRWPGLRPCCGQRGRISPGPWPRPQSRCLLPAPQRNSLRPPEAASGHDLLDRMLQPASFFAGDQADNAIALHCPPGSVQIRPGRLLP